MGEHLSFHRWPRTLIAGAVIILIAELLLAVDVYHRGGIIVPPAPGQALPALQSKIEYAGRWMAVNMTPICWIGYLLLLDGLLTWQGWRRGGVSLSPIRRRPNRFVLAYLTSVPVWCFFDWVNFAFIDAWRYHGLPPRFGNRVVGYLIAFAAITPGMLLAAQWLQESGMRRLRTTGVRINRAVQVACLLLGVAFLVYPFFVRHPIGSLTLWVSAMFLIDPINYWLGAPSIIGDWRAGRWGRTLALMSGGAICGLLWEFWNYWALTKWTYHLPFLGSLENYRYFEMPLLGFLGFLPFPIECWVVLNLFIVLCERAGLRLAEPLPDDDAVL